MTFRVWLAALCLVAPAGSGALAAPAPGKTVSLEEAQEIALRNHPRIESATYRAQAGAAVTREVRSAYYPSVMAHVTGVGARDETTLASGSLATSAVFSRVASGVTATQLVTDFGRTASLTQSAKLRNASEEQATSHARAQVLLEVRQAYYGTLAAEAILKVARADVDLRRLTLRRVTALAEGSLRSTLDVTFARVNVSRAELSLSRAEDAQKASHARLSAAMGYQEDQEFAVVDEAPPERASPVEELVLQALRDRPDLAALNLETESLEIFAKAEKRLRNPTVTALAAAGVAPVRDQMLRGTYSAAGVDVSIPFLNGGLFKARKEEAELRSNAAAKDVEALAVEVARDVRVAWLATNDAIHRMDVAQRLITEADESLRLAQARYESGLGSIVELTEAQLNQTAAQIEAASAKYDYLSLRAALDYADGSLR